MFTITPAVLAHTANEYKQRLQKVDFADRIQIDLMDGEFAKPLSINPAQVYWNEGQLADIHLMFDDPRSHIETLLVKQPHLIILHAESSTFREAFEELSQFTIKLGVALLPDTTPEQMADYIQRAQHCLVFGGELGSYGGTADLTQLAKVAAIKEINPDIEVGWDGGANESNIIEIGDAGVDIINVGGAIQDSKHPQQAFESLSHSVN